MEEPETTGEIMGAIIAASVVILLIFTGFALLWRWLGLI